MDYRLEMFYKKLTEDSFSKEELVGARKTLELLEQHGYINMNKLTASIDQAIIDLLVGRLGLAYSKGYKLFRTIMYYMIESEMTMDEAFAELTKSQRTNISTIMRSISAGFMKSETYQFQRWNDVADLFSGDVTPYSHYPDLEFNIMLEELAATIKKSLETKIYPEL